MNIALYTPLNHPGVSPPSGDTTMARGLQFFLSEKGHQVTQISSLRTRNIFQDKARLSCIRKKREKALALARCIRADVWLTFHSYWKAPDMLGPWCCRQLNIPYVMHKAMHAGKRCRVRKTLPGCLVNQKALLQADAVFSNDVNDMPGLDFLPNHKVQYLPPGINTTFFYPDYEAGTALRKRLSMKNKRIIAAAAMLRPGVKTESITNLLESCSLLPHNLDFQLLIAGDGPSHKHLQDLAMKLLPGRCQFLGQLETDDLRALYSAADIFAFPGIGESLGMVYLEAMCCGTPVVAYGGPGPSQLIRNNETGVLVSPMDIPEFSKTIGRLLLDEQLLAEMGRNARLHVLKRHGLYASLEALETTLLRLTNSDGKKHPER